MGEHGTYPYQRLCQIDSRTLDVCLSQSYQTNPPFYFIKWDLFYCYLINVYIIYYVLRNSLCTYHRVVVDTSGKLPKHISMCESFNRLIIIYLNFWFTWKKKCVFLGTVRRNTLKNLNFPIDKVLMNKSIIEVYCTTKFRNINIIAVVWWATKIVNLF